MSRQISITVRSPRGHEETFEFNRDTKVGTAAEEIADDFGYNADNPTFTHDGEELERNRPLTSYQLDGETVILSNTGRGAVRSA